MPAKAKKASRPSASAAARVRAEDNDRRLERVTQSLEAAQKDLTAIGGSLGTGAGDLRRDVKRALTDARRDVVKMRRSVQRDLGRLQKDLTKAARAGSTARPRAKAAASTAGRRRTAASSR